MKLEKAIEILADSVYRDMTTFNEDSSQAQKLGIEAIKFRQRWEVQKGDDNFPLLPGETRKWEEM